MKKIKSLPCRLLALCLAVIMATTLLPESMFGGGTGLSEVKAEETSTTGKQIPEDAITYGGDYYKIFEEYSYTWDKAERFCEKMGGHLVSITSLEENEFLTQQVNNGNKNVYWIGGLKENNSWKWISGEQFVYKNFAHGQPDNYNGNENRLTLCRVTNPNSRNQTLGYWNDLQENGKCGNEPFFGVENIGFICEWDESSGTTEKKDETSSDVPEAKAYTDLEGVTKNSGKIWFDYDENDFSLSSLKYHHSLGKTASAISAMTYSIKTEFNKMLEESMGYTGVKNINDPTSDSEGLYAPFTIAHKKILLDGKETEILFIAICGTKDMEWLDNFDSGTGETHEGFKRASDFVLDKINKYLNDNKANDGFDKNAEKKIFITGHSRGAAVANLLGKSVNDGKLDITGFLKEDIFVYTFATPNSTSDSSRNNARYNNIYNIVNPEDFVTRVLPSKWGYGRYGITYVLPSKTTEKNGKGNYVNYADYLVKLRGWYAEAKPDIAEYESYKSGAVALQNYIDEVISVVPNIKEYYLKDLVIEETKEKEPEKSLHNLYKYALGGNRSNNYYYEKKSYAVMADAAGKNSEYYMYGYGFLGLESVAYFAVHAGNLLMLRADFQCAHTSETYYAGMKVLTEEQLTQSRKTKKGVVLCPVDVTIYDDDNKIVGRIKDNNVDETIEDGITMTVDGDSKEFYLPASADYKVILTGNDEGTMDYSLCEIDPDSGESSRMYYENVPVENGKTMTQTVSADESVSNVKLMDSTTDKEITGDYFDSSKLGSVDIEVETEGIGTADSRYGLTPGDYVTLTALTDENNSFLGWYNSAGELVSTEKEYSFSVHESAKYTAKFTNNVVAQTGIELEKSSYKLDVGDVITLEASVLPKNATDKDLTYKSSDESVVSVDELGIIQALKNGKATITVSTSDGKYKESYSITVGNTKTDDKTTDKPSSEKKKVKITALRLTGLSKQIAAGKKIKLSAWYKPGNAAKPKLKWTSSNTKVATVTQNGVVTLKKKSGGKSFTITVTALDGSGKKAVFKIKSMKGVVKKVTIKGAKSVKAGRKLKLKAKVKATKKANKKLIWSSSNTKYATVSAKGVVKTKKAGKGKKVKITAMATDGSGKKATVKIKIK